MNDLLAKVKKYSPSADVGIISKAYEYAARHHAKHKRLSGDPYITHPIAVARILVDLEQDVNTIAASLLHDLIEDASVTQDDIYREFGQEIAKLVEGVTKLSQISFVNREERQGGKFRKMFVAMGEDYHVIVIKLADRLHNMQPLQYLSPEKQKEIAL